MASIALASLAWWRPFGYLLVFLGMIIEGDAVLFTAFFLSHQGFFDPVYLFITAFIGVLFGDVLWYWLGAWFSNSFVFIARWAERIARPFDAHIIERPLRTIFLSKFAYGIHHALLMRAGALRLPLSKFMRDDFISTFFWMAIVGGLGFFFGASYSLIRHYLRFVEGAVLFGLLAFFILWHFVALISRKEL